MQNSLHTRAPFSIVAEPQLLLVGCGQGPPFSCLLAVVVVHCSSLVGQPAFLLRCTVCGGCPLPGFLQRLTTAELSMLRGHVFSGMRWLSQHGAFPNWLLQASRQLHWGRGGKPCLFFLRPHLRQDTSECEQIFQTAASVLCVSGTTAACVIGDRWQESSLPRVLQISLVSSLVNFQGSEQWGLVFSEQISRAYLPGILSSDLFSLHSFSSLLWANVGERLGVWSITALLTSVIFPSSQGLGDSVFKIL